MSISRSRQSYTDCAELYERALADPRGVRLHIGPEGTTRHFIMRMHQCRQINREDNAKIYPLGDPMHGASTWDCVQCTMRMDTEGEWYVYVEKTLLDAAKIESLSEIEGEFEEIRQLEPADAPKLITDRRRI